MTWPFETAFNSLEGVIPSIYTNVAGSPGTLGSSAPSYLSSIRLCESLPPSPKTLNPCCHKKSINDIASSFAFFAYSYVGSFIISINLRFFNLRSKYVHFHICRNGWFILQSHSFSSASLMVYSTSWLILSSPSCFKMCVSLPGIPRQPNILKCPRLVVISTPGTTITFASGHPVCKTLCSVGI